VRVHPIGPPSPEEQGKHWLYRFWNAIPAPGSIAIFDRSWYGRVLVERVEDLAPKKAWQRAYREINEFERALTEDGIHLIKFYLKISKEEQFKRFQKRLNDPYKHWKITKDDLRARERWDDYAVATKDMIANCSDAAPWHIIPANDKDRARQQVLKITTKKLAALERWMEKEALSLGKRKLARELEELEKRP
jgi:polyphosphate kinase 2 (PPK2 family)